MFIRKDEWSQYMSQSLQPTPSLHLLNQIKSTPSQMGRQNLREEMLIIQAHGSSGSSEKTLKAI